MQKRKYFNRLFTTYMIIISIFTFLLSITGFIASYEMKKRDLEQKQIQIFQNYRESFDKNLTMTFSNIEQLYENESVIKYVQDNGNDYVNVTKTYYKLAGLNSQFRDVGFSLSIGLKNNETMVTNSGTYNIKDYSKEIGIKNIDINNQFIYFDSRFRYMSYKVLTPNLNSNNGLINILVWDEEKLPSLFIIVSINPKEMLYDLNDSKEEFFDLYYNKSLIYGIGSIDDRKSFKNIKDLLSPLGDQILSSTERSGIILSMRSKVFPDLCYVYSYEKKDNIFWKISIISLLFLVLLAVFAFIVSLLTNYMYRPIKRLLQTYDKNNESNINDMDFFENIIPGVFSEYENLKGFVKSITYVMKGSVFRDMIYGISVEDRLSNIIKEYNLYYLNEGCTACIVQFDKSQLISDEISRDEFDKIYSNVIKMFEEELNQIYKCEVFEIDFQSIGIIINETTDEALNKYFSAFITKIEIRYDILLTAAIGSSVSQLSEIGNSLCDAFNMLHYKYLRAGSNVLTLKDLTVNDNLLYYYPINIEYQLIEYIVGGNDEYARNIVSDIVRRNFHLQKLTKEALGELRFAITATFKRIFQQLNLDQNKAFGEGNVIYLELASATSGKEFEGYLCKIIDKIIKLSCSNIDNLESKTVRKILYYIQLHYSEDISLIQIGEKFNLSISHISKIFKDKLNINYKDYINKYRVDKAKEILTKKPSIKIKDLAEMVGCNNTVTLLRIFKKYEGISPTKFLEQKQNFID